MLTPAQIRMARAALRWTRDDLAKAAGLNPTTVSHVESGRRRTYADTLARVEQALREAGVEFAEHGWVRKPRQKREPVN